MEGILDNLSFLIHLNEVYRMYEASAKGNIEVVKILLVNRSNFHLKSYAGKTALFYGSFMIFK